MKEVMAVIRMNMMNRTKAALSDADITSFTAREALGRGKGLVDFNALKGVELEYEEAISQLGDTRRLVPKRILFVVVPNNLVKKAVDVIIKVNRTGKSGDGKIFVLPMLNSVRVRTGEEGDTTLDE